MEGTNSFPRNLAYSIKQLNNFSQQKVRFLSDRLSTSIGPGEIARFTLPAGSIHLDARTFAQHFKFSASISGGPDSNAVSVHAPRYTSSLIKRISVYCNNVLLTTINDYGLTYNTIADMNFGQDAMSKRCLENVDPSVIYKSTDDATGSYISAVRGCDPGSGANVNSDTSRPFVINNYLGFLNELSTPTLPMNALGTLMIEVEFAPANVCYLTAPPTTAGSAAAGTITYTINELYMTCSKIVFNSDEYYRILYNKLQSGEGLTIAFRDYYVVRSNLQQKSSGVSHNYNVNANCLDMILATTQIETFNTPSYLQLFGSQNTAATAQIDNGGTITTLSKNFTFSEAMGLQGFAYSTKQTNNKLPNNGGDLFNQSSYYARNATGLIGAQFFVNSTAVDLWQKDGAYIYETALEDLGLKNIDVNGSVHPGLLSVWHFLKYYFVHTCRFNNLSGDSAFWKSGMDAGNTPINVQYNATFNSTCTDKVYAVFINCITRLLNVSSGRQIVIV